MVFASLEDKRLLNEPLEEAWRAHQRLPISLALTLAPEGLVLGAGTVLVEAEGEGLLKGLKGRETRVLALLSAAYGRPIAPSVLGNIERDKSLERRRRLPRPHPSGARGPATASGFSTRSLSAVLSRWGDEAFGVS